jgi:hypothetical protein
MGEFGTGYYNPMDREYAGHHDHGHGFPGSQGKSTSDVGVNIGDFGMTIAMGPVPNVKAIQAKLHPGIKTLEFVFSGTGKGQAGQQTPGMYGKKQRQAFVEIGQANKVDFTTHATFGVYGLAGMDQQGNFSKASKNFSLTEVKRAIEFAADVAKGGPVVVHTGEFSRPLIDADWNNKEEYQKRFQMHDDEENKTSFRVVDTRTGGVIEEARKNKKVPRPVWLTARPGQEYTVDGVKKIAPTRKDEKGRSIDENGIPIYLDYFDGQVDPGDRVPVFDSESQEFKIEQMGWDELEHEAKIMTQRAKKEWHKWNDGKISDEEYKKSQWYERIKDIKVEDELKNFQVKPEEAYIIATLETNAAHSRGWAIQYGGDFQETVNSIKKVKKALSYYEEMEDAVPESEKWKLKQQQARDSLGHLQGLIPIDTKLPSDLLKSELKKMEQELRYKKEASASQWSQAKQSEETQKFVQSAESYAFQESYDSYANLGINAMEQSNTLEKKGALKKPISVAMENLFPEQYGSHPDELIKLVKGSRDRMVGLLVQRGMDKDAAKEEAKQHITSTIDLGHMNMWRKYWVGDQKKSLAENDAEFDKWAVKKLGDMVDAGIVGHIHLNDNYGYQDEHLAPGEGNTPTKEMLKILKKKGYKGELVIEPGADYTTDVTGFHSVMKTWEHVGSPAYGAGSGLAHKGRSWGQVQYGWFGQTHPPYFTVGAYSPTEDWQLWSGVSLDM